MTDPLSLTITSADYQTIARQQALENLGLRQELAVCVRTLNELRAEVARLRAQVETVTADAPVHKKLEPAKTGRAKT